MPHPIFWGASSCFENSYVQNEVIGSGQFQFVTNCQVQGKKQILNYRKADHFQKQCCVFLVVSAQGQYNLARTHVIQIIDPLFLHVTLRAKPILCFAKSSRCWIRIASFSRRRNSQAKLRWPGQSTHTRPSSEKLWITSLNHQQWCFKEIYWSNQLNRNFIASMGRTVHLPTFKHTNQRNPCT